MCWKSSVVVVFVDDGELWGWGYNKGNFMGLPAPSGSTAVNGAQLSPRMDMAVRLPVPAAGGLIVNVTAGCFGQHYDLIIRSCHIWVLKGACAEACRCDLSLK